MTTYAERIERARKVVQGEVLLTDEIEAIVAAFLGDDEAFIICPDCNGNGAIWTMAANPTLDETEQSCTRCEQWQGMVPMSGPEPEHMCGLAGFNPMEGDWCLGAHGGAIMLNCPWPKCHHRTDKDGHKVHMKRGVIYQNGEYWGGKYGSVVAVVEIPARGDS